MRYILFSLVAFLFSGDLLSQTTNKDTTELKMIVKSEGDSMSSYFLQRDFKQFFSYIYPAMLKMWGGAEELSTVLEKGFNEMDSNKESYVKVEIGEPSTILLNGAELQCTLSQTIEMRKATGKKIVYNTLIGISTDKGANWYFVYADNNLKEMQKYLPNLSDELVIPERVEPIFIPD